MKREEKWTPVSSKTRSIYKYQLQATNQILKDTLDIYPSSLHSTAQTTRQQNARLEESDDYLCDQNSGQKYFSDRARLQDLPRARQKDLFLHQNPLNPSENKIQEKQLIRHSASRDNFSPSRVQKRVKQRVNDLNSHDPSQFCSFSSENQDNLQYKPEHPHHSQGGKSPKKERYEEDRKELKRQRRGLAHISLKVKNIVSKRGKMSFKDVSDQVLKESMKDLPTNIEQREKEMKNIRRRVYDALNVLVSVGILGKQQRCVVHTEMTNIPGKKLSAHWELITEKKRLLEEQEYNFQQKLKNYNLLKKNYQMILLLHERNSTGYGEYLQRSCLSSPEERLVISPSQDRFYFPLIFLIPPKKHANKIKVQIQNEEKQSQCVKRFIVDGNQYVLTDLDILKFIHFSEQMRGEQLHRVKQHLFNIESLADESRMEEQMGRRELLDFDEDIYLGD